MSMMGRTSSREAEHTTSEVIAYSQYVSGEWQRLSGALPDEMMLSVFINGQELVTILCTPEKVNCLIVGFLHFEGFITNLDDITMMRICLEESLADVRLTQQKVVMPTRRILTSGCGGGTTFEQGANIQPLSSSRRISPAQIFSSFRLLQRKPESQRGNDGIRRGVHVSALSDGDKLLIKTVDIGRHNTLDKIFGECILTQVPTEDMLLLTTGRISSDMLIKAAKMGVPVVASLNSATKRAVKLGADLGITVVGYARGDRLSVYTHPQHILGLPAA